MSNLNKVVRSKMKKLLLALFLGTSSPINADLLVSFIDEMSLPYEFSPSNYENSPSNYKNSVNNYENSDSNYNNSSANYSNSSSSGKPLLIEEDGELISLGHYVLSEGGVTNIYSSSGDRIFYNPKKGIGVYHGTSGEFCGVLALVKNKYRLVLTEVGKKALFMAQ